MAEPGHRLGQHPAFGFQRRALLLWPEHPVAFEPAHQLQHQIGLWPDADLDFGKRGGLEHSPRGTMDRTQDIGT